MKTILGLFLFSITFGAQAFEGHYQSEEQTRNCASEFEITTQEDCLILEYGAAAARTFCKINKGPSITSREVEEIRDGEVVSKMREFTTVVETLIVGKLIVSESIALKNKYGLTLKRENHVTKLVKTEKGLVQYESRTVLESMKLPLHKESKCSYKAE
jgi:hypothetical protein